VDHSKFIFLVRLNGQSLLSLLQCTCIRSARELDTIHFLRGVKNNVTMT
jgi:hypothetical protein